MRYRRLFLVVLIAVSLFISSGCFVRIIGPPLLLPVPVPFGGWGYGPGYYGHPYHGYR
jgi:hypothetical protein